MIFCTCISGRIHPLLRVGAFSVFLEASAILFFLVALAPVSADAQTRRVNTTVSHPGFTQVNDPGVWAMGRSGVALRGRPGAVDVNPAAIGQAGRVQGGVDLGTDPLFATEHLFGIHERSPFVTGKTGRWAVAAQVNVLNAGEFERRDENGRVTETITARHISTKLFAAYDLSPTWTLGGAVGYSDDKTIAPTFMGEDNSVSSVVVDLGAYGEWERSVGEDAVLRPSVGVSLMNFGANSELGDSNVEYPTPTTLRFGGALYAADGEKWYGRSPISATMHLELSKQMVSIEQPNAFTRPETSGPFAALIDTWRPERRLEVTANGEEIVESSVWDQVEKHLGVEVSAYEVVDLRVGRSQVGDETGIPRYTTFGVGLDLVYARFDYAGTVASSFDLTDKRSAFRVTAMIPLNGTYEDNWLADLF